jgi:hypothetical protein
MKIGEGMGKKAHRLAPDLEPRPVRYTTRSTSEDEEDHHDPGEHPGRSEVCESR